MPNTRIKTSPVSKQIPFDNSQNSFDSSNAQEAIEEARSKGTNRRIVASGETYRIDVNQECVVKRRFVVAGRLVLQGRLTII